MPLFQRPVLFPSHDGPKVQMSVISRDLAELLFDLGAEDWRPVGSIGFCNKVGANHDEHIYGPKFKSIKVGEIKARHYDKVLFAMVDGLPKRWESDVYYIGVERSRAKLKAQEEAAVESYAGPAVIKRALQAMLADKPRCFKPPEVVDMSGLKPLKDRKYKPAGGCGAKLKLKEAVSYGYSQESYADHSYYLIPVEGEIGDASVCRSNLHQWCEAIRTHNGFAGSGSTFSAELVIEPDGAYVKLDIRASISD